MFCIISIFKNESEIFSEWLQHYINEGCDKFFLIDNGSTDQYLDKIELYKDKIELIIDNKKHSQDELYNKYFKEKIKDYEWTLICDLDEFVYSRNNFKTIKDYLDNIYDDNISQISISWKMFGSNNFNTKNKKEPSSVIDSFTKRTNYNKDEGFHGVVKIIGDIKMNTCKCITRSSKILRLSVHNCSLKSGITVDSSNNNTNTSLPFIPCNETILDYQNLHLNHYCIRSLDWFLRVKATRGDVNSKNVENIRNINYFNSFDKVSNDIEDLELKNKEYNQS